MYPSVFLSRLACSLELVSFIRSQTFSSNEDHRKLALAIQQMWQQNLGIEVELVNQDWKVYLSREMVGDFQVFPEQISLTMVVLMFLTVVQVRKTPQQT